MWAMICEYCKQERPVRLYESNCGRCDVDLLFLIGLRSFVRDLGFKPSFALFRSFLILRIILPSFRSLKSTVHAGWGAWVGVSDGYPAQVGPIGQEKWNEPGHLPSAVVS